MRKPVIARSGLEDVSEDRIVVVICELVVLGWLLICWALQATRKDCLDGLQGHAYVAFALYAFLVPLEKGTQWALDTKSMDVAFLGMGLLLLGNALFVGWFASPGAVPFLLAPVRGVMTILGRPCPRWTPMWTDDKRCWCRFSTRLAVFIFIGTISALLWAVYRIYR